MGKITVIACLSILCGPAFAAEPLETFSSDSRRWSRADEAVVLADFSQAEPAGALITGRREKGKWKLIPWASADLQGMALSAYSQTNPAVVRLPLGANKGWHAVYVGLATVSGGFDIGSNGVRTRLSDEPVYLRMACNLELLPNRRGVIHEQFLTVAEVQGQSIEIAPLPGRPATVCYVKLVPLTTDEVQTWTAWRTQPRPRTSIATFDGHSWIWPYAPERINRNGWTCMPKPAKKRTTKIKPHWDKKLGILSYGGIIVYQRKHSAWVVDCIFDAFAHDRWPKRIDDPLPPQMEAINARLDNPLIRFFMDGTGTGICWEPVENRAPRGKREK